MATSKSITSSEARAQVLLENAANWSRGVAKTPVGEVNVVVFASGSRPGAVYLTRQDGLGCNCPGAVRYLDCCHMRAVRADNERFTAFVDAALGPQSKPRATYADLFPACKEGCGELVDGLDGRCRRCSEDAEFEARRDAQRASRRTA
jgi:hypothetical protein